MTEEEIVEQVTLKLTHACVWTSKNDKNWGERFFNSALERGVWHKVHPNAVVFESFPFMPRLSGVFVGENGDVCGKLR